VRCQLEVEGSRTSQSWGFRQSPFEKEVQLKVTGARTTTMDMTKTTTTTTMMTTTMMTTTTTMRTATKKQMTTTITMTTTMMMPT
jgi:hypothetical protein